jgi:WD40 repeat protein
LEAHSRGTYVTELTNEQKSLLLIPGPCGRLAGCGDNYIRIFEEREGDGGEGLAPGEGVPSFDLVARAMPSQPCDINCVTWHPRVEGLLASAHDNGSVAIWQFERGLP